MSVTVRALLAVLRGPDWLGRALTFVPATVDGQTLHPKTRLFVSLTRLNPREPHTQSVAAQRAQIAFLEVATSAPTAPVRIETLPVPLPDRTLAARVYRPPNPTGAALLYLHGGGFTTGTVESYDGPCARLAHDAGLVVVSLDYRLAPEHRFPAALDDTVDAYRWLRSIASTLGVDPDRIGLGGDSAGGNLTASACHLLTAAGERPAAQVLIYPAVDMQSDLPSNRLFARGYYLTHAHALWFHEQYVPDPARRTDPRASPLLSPSFAGLPPALVVTAGLDVLRDEGRAYADRLGAAGVPVDRYEVEGLPHGFITLDGVLPAADDAMRELTRRVRALFAAT